MHDCRDCGCAIGALHTLGCDNEMCRLCGGQAISCHCIDLFEEQVHPDAEDFPEDPSDEAWAAYDKAVTEAGGRLPWLGEFYGCAECREYGFWARFVPGESWVPCDKDHPEASEDLNRLIRSCRWHPSAARWMR